MTKGRNRSIRRRLWYVAIGFIIAFEGAVFGAGVLLFVDESWGVLGEDWGDPLILAGGVAGFLAGGFVTYLIAHRNYPSQVSEQREHAADYDDEVARRPDLSDGPTDAGR